MISRVTIVLSILLGMFGISGANGQQIFQGYQTIHLTFRPIDVVYSPDGLKMAIGGIGHVAVLQTSNDSIIYSATISDPQYSRLQFYPDGSRLLVTSLDSFYVWNIADQRMEWRAYGISPALRSDGGVIAVLAGVDSIVYYNATSGLRLGYSSYLFGANPQVRFGTSGADIIIANSAGEYVGFNTIGNAVSFKVKRKSGLHFDISPDNQRFITGERRPTILGALAGDSILALNATDHGKQYNAIYSPNGRTIATSCLTLGNESIVRLWDAATGAFVSEIGKPSGEAYGLAFRPDGMALACTSLDSIVYIFNLSDIGAVETTPRTTAGAIALTAYPDPAADQVVVHYTMSASGAMHLALLNSLGVQGQSVDHAAEEAGEHQAVLDTRALPSGIYFLRLRAAGHEATRTVRVQH